MKKPLRIKDFVPFTIIMAFIIIGVYFASIVDLTYKPISNGILGITLLALEYRIYYLSPKLNAKEPTRLLFEYPTGLKYISFGLFLAVVNFWVISRIIDMIYYLITLFNNRWNF
jgi:hypothetical protein